MMSASFPTLTDCFTWRTAACSMSRLRSPMLQCRRLPAPHFVGASIMSEHGQTTERKRSQTAYWLVASALLTVGGAGACILYPRESGQAEEVSTPSAATPATGLRLVACIGDVDVVGGMIALAPTIPGRVAEVPVRENQRVKEGDPLLRIEDDQPRADLKQAQANVLAAQAQLAEARKAPQQQDYLLTQQRAA